jgi:hypothetical protein
MDDVVVAAATVGARAAQVHGVLCLADAVTPKHHRPAGRAPYGRLQRAQRRRLLDYLKQKDTERYADLIRRLGIRK